MIGKVDRVARSDLKLGAALERLLADDSFHGVEHFYLNVETERGAQVALLRSGLLDELVAAAVLGEVKLN